MEQEEAVSWGAASDRLNLQLGEVTDSFSVIKVIRFSVGIGFRFKLLPNRRFGFLLWQQILCYHLVGHLSPLSSRYKWNVTPGILCYDPAAGPAVAPSRSLLHFVIARRKCIIASNQCMPNHCVSPETLTTTTSGIPTIHSVFNVHVKQLIWGIEPAKVKPFLR